MDWCETNSLDYVFGLVPNSTLRRHITGLEESTAARFKAAPTAGEVRRFEEFFDAAKTWSRVRRIVARVEAGSDGTDTRFIVPNLGHGNGRSLYQHLLPTRPGGEPHQGLENPSRRRPHLVPQGCSCTPALAKIAAVIDHANHSALLGASAAEPMLTSGAESIGQTKIATDKLGSYPKA